MEKAGYLEVKRGQVAARFYFSHMRISVVEVLRTTLRISV